MLTESLFLLNLKCSLLPILLVQRDPHMVLHRGSFGTVLPRTRDPNIQTTVTSTPPQRQSTCSHHSIKLSFLWKDIKIKAASLLRSVNLSKYPQAFTVHDLRQEAKASRSAARCAAKCRRKTLSREAVCPTVCLFSSPGE